MPDAGRVAGGRVESPLLAAALRRGRGSDREDHNSQSSAIHRDRRRRARLLRRRVVRSRSVGADHNAGSAYAGPRLSTKTEFELVGGRGPVETGRLDGPGSGGADAVRWSARSRLPWSKDTGHRNARQFPERSRTTGNIQRLRRAADGGGRPRAADRLRQRRQFVAVTRRHATKRDRRPVGAWSEPAASHAPIAYRERNDRYSGRRDGLAVGLLDGACVALGDKAQSNTVPSRPQPRYSSLRLRLAGLRLDRPDVRIGAGAAIHQTQSRPGAQR